MVRAFFGIFEVKEKSLRVSDIEKQSKMIIKSERVMQLFLARTN
jgi:hypothetical protein